MFWVLLIGLILGSAGATLPAGPSGVLAYARAAEGRFREARAMVFGRVLAEGIYAMAGWWGMSNLLRVLPWLQPSLNLVVGVILPVLGVYLLRWDPAQVTKSGDGGGTPPPRVRRKGFALGFSLTALNPTVIASWGAVSALIAATGWFPFVPRHAPLFGLGIAVGGWCWFHLFFRFMEARRASIKPRTLGLLVRVLGLGILGLGLWLLYSGVAYFL